MRVLVATDGSAPAAVGVQMAAGIAWPGGTTLRVVTAIDTGTALFGGPWPAAAILQASDITAELRAGAQDVVERAAEPLRRTGLTVEPVVVDGRAATAIVEEATRFGAELIILGARGHGTIAEMVLGSVSAEVIDTARVPVLIARDRHLRRILLATDGSRSAEGAASLLETWPIFKGAVVHVVTVAEPSYPWWATGPDVAAPIVAPIVLEALDEAREERRKLADAMAMRLRSAGFEADAEMREGSAAQEILAAAAAWGAELVLVGTHGRTGLARIALGSVARNVLHHARTSVLVVRGPAGSGDGERGT
jgi:nucleotide-binding universal stress UspA family protein